MFRFAIATLFLYFAVPITYARQAAPAQPSAQPKVDRPPVPLNSPQAEFPAKARQKQNQGECLISVTVDTDGIPQDLRVIRCSDAVFQQNSLTAAAEYRFKPAIGENDKPVPARITLEIEFRLFAGDGMPVDRNSGDFVRVIFSTPPGVTSSAPDANGTYPLVKGMDAPKLARFNDVGFNDAALMMPLKGAGCDVVLTVSKRGKPSDARATHCDDAKMESAAVASLLKSRFKPAEFRGKPVAARVSVHLVYLGFDSIN